MTNFETKFSDFGAKIGGALDNGIGAAKDTVKAVGEVVINTKDKAVEKGKEMIETGKAAKEKVETELVEIAAEIEDFVDDRKQDIKDGVNAAGETIKDGAMLAGGLMIYSVAKAAEGIESAVDKGIEIADDVKDAIDTGKAIFKGIGNGIAGYVKDEIQEKVDKVKDKVKEEAAELKDHIKEGVQDELKNKKEA